MFQLVKTLSKKLYQRIPAILRIRTLFRSFCPPVLYKIIKAKVYSDSRHVFEGMYDSEDSLKEDVLLYENQAAIDRHAIVAKEKIALMRDQITLPKADSISHIHNLFPLLVSVVAHKNGNVSVIDIGGKFGVSYLRCRSLMCNLHITYHIVDTPPVIKIGQDFYRNDKHIQFHKTVPQLDHVDIVYVSATLQYFSDCESLLAQLVALRPKYIFLVNHLMGTAPTYLTVQVKMDYKKNIYWVHNLERLIQFLKHSGYESIYLSPNYQPEIHFDNFKEEYKVKDSCNLLFARAPGNKSKSG